MSVNKLLFFGDEEKWFNKIQKRLICKLHKSVTCEIRNLLEERKKQKILEEIPDDLVISLQDSQDAGNSWDVTGTFWTPAFSYTIKKQRCTEKFIKRLKR